MILIDQDGKLLAVSGCAAESLGRHPADLVGTNIRSIVPEPFASHHLAQVGQVLRSGQPLRMDDDRDGQCIRSCLYPLLGLDGASDCVLLHKCGAAAGNPRRESPGSDPALRDGAWRQAGTQSHEMVTRHFAEPEARWLYVSPAAQQSYGHVPEALIGRTPLDFYHPDESNRIRSALDAVLAGRSATVNARFRRSDGSYAWIETSFEPVVAGLTTGRPLEIIGVSRDITARVQAEQALRFGGSGLAAVVETFGAGIWEWDLRSDHVYLSPRQKALIGFGDDFPNSAMAWWERVWPEDLPRLQRSFQAVRDGETDTYEAEYRIRHRDGNYRWIHSAGHAVRDGREAGVYMTGIDLDITARKTMEDELQAARAEAAQASQAKARLLAAAGHDMRQPVHALGFFLAALNRRCQDNPEAVKVVLNMEDCLGALQRMLNSLLDLTRLEAGILKPEIVAFPIDPLFEKLRTEFAGLARRRRLDLRVVPSGAVVNSDPALLEIILRNLVANALQYTAKGKVLMGCRAVGQEISIQVWDTGVGIPGDQLPTVFKEFARLNTAAGTEPSGLGLGLATSNRLAASLGHEITVRSEPGAGSMFAIRLPRAAQQPRRRIVVIDDDPAIREAMRTLLEDWGCTAVDAGSAESALDKLRDAAIEPDLLIVDYMLEQDGAGGPEAIDRIRGALDRNVPAVIVTGATDNASLSDIEQRGFRVLRKPLRPDEVEALLPTADGT